MDGRPAFDDARVREIVRELYGFVPALRPLPSERDQNFRVAGESGAQFVFKLANAAESRSGLELQHAMLRHLAGRAPELGCPRVVETVGGRAIETVDGHLARMLTWLPGTVFADVKPQTKELRESLGAFLARLDRALEEFEHDAVPADLPWDPHNALEIMRGGLEHLGEGRAIVEPFVDRFATTTAPILGELRSGVIHNDANDYNVLVSDVDRDSSSTTDRAVCGLIDYGDVVRAPIVCDLAVACSYASLHNPDPLAAAADVARGYHRELALAEEELAHLFDLIFARLAVSVCVSSRRRAEGVDSDYLLISERPAWAVIERFGEVHPRLARATFRDACGLEPCPETPELVAWIRAHPRERARVLPDELFDHPEILDLSVEGPEAEGLGGIDLDRRLAARGATVGVGRYAEPRVAYTSELFETAGNDGPEWRTVHIGIDLFAAARTPVRAPLDGVVHSFRDNPGDGDYGPTILLEHDAGGRAFWTLYGHLSKDSLDGLERGQRVARGEEFARFGDATENGGWAPHLHFQFMVDLIGHDGDFPGVCTPAAQRVWRSLVPDPNLLLGIDGLAPAEPGRPAESLLAVRRRHLGRGLSLSYRRPLKIVRGRGQFLFDSAGRKYLDAVNNVPHVGHCHPRVVAAAHRQNAVLNTNTRYLHEEIVRYVERLCATFPEPLSVCYLVCSGSEANELALRLAYARTGRRGVVAVEGAYHGNTAALVGMSSYKFAGPGGEGAAPNVRVVPMPDPYRGRHGGDGPAYADHVREAAGDDCGAFFCESVLGCGGQIVLPAGYLATAYAHVCAAGGVCVADEVQVGVGRVGSHFWAFELQGVVPDIVTVGKPIGNGHPLAAVITTPEIAASFDNGMEYFNTFGGNPVSCAIGNAVLDVIEDEGLQRNAAEVGARLRDGLGALKVDFPIVGDVRGAGLFLGVELVHDRESKAPAPVAAAYVVERMKERGILLSTDGPLHNVLKLKPPMVFSGDDADRLVATLRQVLSEDKAR